MKPLRFYEVVPVSNRQIMHLLLAVSILFLIFVRQDINGYLRDEKIQYNRQVYAGQSLHGEHRQAG